MNIGHRLKNEYKSILHYVGILTIGIGIIELIPLAILPFFKSTLTDLFAFLLPGLSGLAIGVATVKITPKNNTFPSSKAGAVIISVTWLVAVVLGSLPFVISGHLSFIDAVFEAMSGWTTTGLSVVNVAQIPEVYLFWRSFMQFVGGAGFAVLMLSAVIGPEAKGLYEAEARNDRFVPSVIDTSRILIKLYLLYFVVGSLLYRFSGMTTFDAVNHSMAALSTGGFSTKPESIGYWNSIPIEIVTILLMILGTTNFSIHYGLLWKRKLRTLVDNEIILFFILMGVAVPLISYALLGAVYQGLGHTIRIALFQAVSALSTSGFQNVPFTQWNIAAILVVIILMIFGGGTGATAGGLKLYRVSVVLKNIYWSIKARIYPKNTIVSHSINKQGNKFLLENDHIMEVLTYASLYLTTYLLGVFVLILSGYNLHDSLFEFASALGTVGLSVGITGPDMPLGAKIAEIMGMWLGRLEFMAIITAVIKLISDSRNIFSLNLSAPYEKMKTRL